MKTDLEVGHKNLDLIHLAQITLAGSYGRSYEFSGYL
jgi:hypothetical protein